MTYDIDYHYDGHYDWAAEHAAELCLLACLQRLPQEDDDGQIYQPDGEAVDEATLRLVRHNTIVAPAHGNEHNERAAHYIIGCKVGSASVRYVLASANPRIRDFQPAGSSADLYQTDIAADTARQRFNDTGWITAAPQRPHSRQASIDTAGMTLLGDLVIPLRPVESLPSEAPSLFSQAMLEDYDISGQVDRLLKVFGSADAAP